MPGHAVALENACKDVVFLVETQVVTKLVVVNGVEGAVSALPACVARLARSTDQSVSVDTGDGGAARASVGDDDAFICSYRNNVLEARQSW